MANITIVSQRLLGHVLPILGVAVELNRRGHRVTMLGHPMNRQLITRSGVDFRSIGWDKVPNLYIDLMMKDVLQTIDPDTDLIIGDSSQSAPAYTAELMNIPWVSFQTTVPLPDSMLGGGKAVNERLRIQYEAQLNEVRSEFGLPPLQDPIRSRGDFAGLSPYLHLIMAMPELAGEGWEFPPTARFVGGNSYDWQATGTAIDSKPAPDVSTIVVCTSSVPRIEYVEVMNRYVEASARSLSERKYDVWICGNEPYAGSEPLPVNVHWLSEHPVHHKLLPEAAAAVTHGGCGTLHQCIRHGVPMVIVPLGADHSVLAERCVQLGVAVVLEPDEISGHVLQRKLDQVTSSDYRERARRLAEIAGKYTPNETSADLVENMMQTGSLPKMRWFDKC